MPSKKVNETEAEQSARFIRDDERMIKKGGFDLSEAQRLTSQAIAESKSNKKESTDKESQ